MKEQIIKIKVGQGNYEIDLYKDNEYGYQIKRNKRVISSSTCPKKSKENVRMWIFQELLQHSIYEISNEIEKLEL